MAAEGDVKILNSICIKHRLNFWSKKFNQYGILLRKLDFDSSKNDLVRNKNRLKVDDEWTNLRLFGSFSDLKICERINRQVVQTYDDCR